MDPVFWHSKRVLLTGHTGFKGSWLTLWLERLGARVHGLALVPPTEPSLFREAGLGADAPMKSCDVRDLDAVRDAMARARPEIVIHMAAQALVRRSYLDPVETFGTNVMGTVNVLEAALHSPGVRCIVNVTTDKCYENREWVWGYREDEAMGGHDAYSSSKGCSELVTSAYRRSFLASKDIAIATARAGNVIGGGDWAADRLVPDVLRAFEGKGEAFVLRHPRSTRPWQHVLEPLSGYMTLAQALWQRGQEVAGAWNFGPNDADVRSVEWVVERLARFWGKTPRWSVEQSAQPHEATLLKLDTSKAKERLAWSPTWSLTTALEETARWHRAWSAGAPARDLCLEQIERYEADMRSRSL